MKRLRILQASGLGALAMIPLSYLLEFVFSSIESDTDPNIAIIWYMGLPVLLGQIIIGYWIGKHVDQQLFLHVFLANMVIVAVNYLYTYLVYGMLLNNPGSVLIVTILIAWPIAIWVKKRRLKN